jgi:RNA polymerase primary sigma factor
MASSWWVDQARRYPLLTPAQEISLGTQVQAWLNHPAPIPAAIERRGRRARERMVLTNLRLVIRISYRYRSVPTHYIDDLIQAGNLGLTRAAEKYDPTRGYRFSTYAYWWIRQSINNFLERYSRTISLPTTHAIYMARVGNALAQLPADLGRQPTQQELADAAGLSLSQLLVMLARPAATVSLDAPSPGTDHEALIGDAIAAPGHNIDEAIEISDQLERIEVALSHLPPQHQRLIRMYYGINHDLCRIEQIAKIEKLQVNRISGMIAAAVDYLRLALNPPSHAPLQPTPTMDPQITEQLAFPFGV